MEKRKPAYGVGRNVSWCSLYGKQYADASKNCKQYCYMIQQSHSWAYVQTNLYFKKIHVPIC